MNIVLNMSCTREFLNIALGHDRAVWQYITVSHKQLVLDVVTKPLAML